MNIRIIDKDESADGQPERSGEAYEIYLQLIELMEQQPNKKAVITFTSQQTGLRRQSQMLHWAHEDGYQLFASVVRGTAAREMYLGPIEEQVA